MHDRVTTLLARAERYQVALLLLLPVLWSVLVFQPSWFTDPGSYFHVGVARRMLEQGWLRQFEWLPHTTLADPYPDMYLGQHLLLLPLTALLEPLLALRLNVLLLSTAVAVSLALVLQRRGVRWAALWVLLALPACPLLLTYALALKGVTTFLVVLIWYVDAVWAGAHRRAFLLSWLSVYVYVGASVLLPFALVQLLVTRAWAGRWETRCLLASMLGLALGMLLSPFWPAHWAYVWAELRTVFERDPTLVAGEYRGADWAMLSGEQLLTMAGAASLAWCVVLLRSLAGGPRATLAAASGTVASLGLLAASMLSGSKMLELFLIFTLLTVPQLVAGLRPWPKAASAVAVAVALASCVWSVRTVWRPMELATQLARPSDYLALGPWLDERTQPQDMIVAPWDDMPGLFLFGGQQRYMAGLNMQFLRDHDRQRFNAYALFYRGVISDPQQTLIKYFDGARYVLTRRVPHLPGEEALVASLSSNPSFEEQASPTPAFRIFYRKR